MEVSIGEAIEAQRRGVVLEHQRRSQLGLAEPWLAAAAPMKLGPLFFIVCI
jgi:hypothetical protein